MGTVTRPEVEQFVAELMESLSQRLSEDMQVLLDLCLEGRIEKDEDSRLWNAYNEARKHLWSVVNASAAKAAMERTRRL